MQRTIELKHVTPAAHVRRLLNERIDHLEEQVTSFAGDATSVHVLFEEIPIHRLYRMALTCHLPGRLMIVAHEERHDAGLAIRTAFRDVERQIKRQKALLRHEHLRRRRKEVPGRSTSEEENS